MTDRLFHLIDDAHVILAVRGGVYKQAKLYRRFVNGEHLLFAGYGAGYVMLLGGDGTSPRMCGGSIWK